VFFFKVTGLVLRGIFLLRKKEIDWFYEGGAAAIFPDGMLDTILYMIYYNKINHKHMHHRLVEIIKRSKG
jgi:hypothetical protein